MTTTKVTEPQKTPQIIRLLGVVLILLFSAVITVASGSYWLLRQANIDIAVGDARERLDKTFEKLGDPLASSATSIYFPLLKGHSTSTPEANELRASGNSESVVEHESPLISRPDRIFIFDPGDGQPLVFDPARITPTIERVSGDRVWVRWEYTEKTNEGRRPGAQTFVGAQRRWENSNARLIVVSRLRTFDSLSGQIAGFTGLVMLLLALLIVLVLVLAQRRFSQQLRELRTVSIKIADDGGKSRLPVKDNELGQLSGHMNNMLETIEARGRIIRQLAFALDHDFREPIASLIAYARLGVKQLPSGEAGSIDTGDLRDTVTKILKVAEHMDESTEGHLQMFRFTGEVTDGEPDTLEELDLNEIASEVFEACELMADQQSVSIVLETAQECKIYGSRALVTRAFSNLVRNAISLSPKNSQVTIRTLVDTGRSIMQVEDHAGGLPQNVMDALANDATRIKSGRPGGTGIGLPVANYIMLVHRGSLDAENTSSGAKISLNFSPGLPKPTPLEYGH